MRTALLAVLLTSFPALAQLKYQSEPVSMRPQLFDKAYGLPLNFGDVQPRKVVLSSDVQSWWLQGDAYEMVCDSVSSNCAYPMLRSKAWAKADVTGRLVHRESAWPWHGLELVFTSVARVGRTDEARFFVRALDGQGRELAAVQTPALNGTTAFANHELHLTVPETAEWVEAGVVMRGNGAVIIRKVDLDEAAFRLTQLSQR